MLPTVNAGGLISKHVPLAGTRFSVVCHAHNHEAAVGEPPFRTRNLKTALRLHPFIPTSLRYTPKTCMSLRSGATTSIQDAIRQVTLCVDFHFVNGLAVLHTISRNINYRTVAFPKTKTTTSIMRELHRVFRVRNQSSGCLGSRYLIY